MRPKQLILPYGDEYEPRDVSTLSDNELTEAYLWKIREMSQRRLRGPDLARFREEQLLPMVVEKKKRLERTSGEWYWISSDLSLHPIAGMNSIHLANAIQKCLRPGGLIESEWYDGIDETLLHLREEADRRGLDDEGNENFSVKVVHRNSKEN